MIKKLSHIAVIVHDLEAALKFWRDALGLELECVEDIPAQQAEVAFLPLGETKIELVRPTANDSGEAHFLTKHGAGMHHIALEVGDLDSMLSRLQAKGIRLINETPVVAAGGKLAAFIHPDSASGVLVELYQSD